jgi:hypothetical protein
MVRLADSWACSDPIKIMGNWNEKTEEFDPDKTFVVVVNEWYDDGRWKSQHDLVFLDNQDGKYYHVRYEKGLTESQYYNPFDGEDVISCSEVSITQKERVIVETTWEYK